VSRPAGTTVLTRDMQIVLAFCAFIVITTIILQILIGYRETIVIRSAEDLFNHRHAQLRNVVERTFGVLKKRFKILTVMAPYKYKKQCRIVIVCCILHNFIKIQNDNDALLNGEEDENVILNDDQSEQLEVDGTNGGDMLRTTLADALWVYRKNQRRKNLNAN
jgi:DDE superfamily endonuclease